MDIDKINDKRKKVRKGRRKKKKNIFLVSFEANPTKSIRFSKSVSM